MNSFILLVSQYKEVICFGMLANFCFALSWAVLLQGVSIKSMRTRVIVSFLLMSVTLSSYVYLYCIYRDRVGSSLYEGSDSIFLPYILIAGVVWLIPLTGLIKQLTGGVEEVTFNLNPTDYEIVTQGGIPIAKGFYTIGRDFPTCQQYIVLKSGEIILFATPRLSENCKISCQVNPVPNYGKNVYQCSYLEFSDEEFSLARFFSELTTGYMVITGFMFLILLPFVGIVGKLPYTGDIVMMHFILKLEGFFGLACFGVAAYKLSSGEMFRKVVFIIVAIMCNFAGIFNFIEGIMMLLG